VLLGRKFKWANSAAVPTFQKLDRVLVSTDWEQKFPLSSVEALTRELSDHTPLLLDTGNASPRGNNRNFRFELSWLTREDFHETITKVWQEENRGDTPMKKWRNKIRIVCRFLRGWEKRKKKCFLVQ
jgi:hypothetical protein